MKGMRFEVLVFGFGLLGCAGGRVEPRLPTQAREERELGARLDAATDLVQAGCKQVPAAFAGDVECAVVLPGVVHAGALLAGRFGRGFAVCETDDGGVSAPIPVTLMGGIAGIAVGVETSDIVLLFTDDAAKRALSKSGIALGVDTSVTAVQLSATDHSKRRIAARSYSRSHGLFVGIELAASLQADEFATAALYGSSPSIDRILSGEIKTPPRAQHFVEAIEARLGRSPKAVAPGAS